MKKKNLKNLALNRKIISNLDATKSKGGADTNSLIFCILSVIDANGINICLQTIKCARTEQVNCASVLVSCITQTEFPTCRDCV